MLARLGYECQAPSDGDEAISAYEKAIAAGRPFDVVMLDLTDKGGGWVVMIQKQRVVFLLFDNLNVLFYPSLKN